MDTTGNLKLPYLFAAQAQKHVTHNEALRAIDAVVQVGVVDRDLTAPPVSSLSDGDRYIVAAPAAGAWAGRDGQIAAWQDGAWWFYEPKAGWLAWIADESGLVVFDGTVWINVEGAASQAAEMFGIHTSADTTNRLAVSSAASLFTHDGAGHQAKINKATAADTGALLFQTDWSGRAELGLAGDDDFSIKVSADGSIWTEALLIDRASGKVSLPATPAATAQGPGRNLLVNGGFTINQRSFAGGALAQNAYGFDRWRAAVGCANLSLSGSSLNLASGTIEQVIEPALWGLASFASHRVTVSLDAPTADIVVGFGSQSATIAQAARRSSVTLELTGADTGNLAFSLRSAAPAAVGFARVQLEIGDTATDWQPRPLPEEQALCQRYFYRRSRSGSYDVVTFMSAHQSGACWGKLLDLPVEMRQNPTPRI